MKKQYIVPTVTVDRFDAQNIIATSDLIFGGTNDQPGGPTAAEAKRRGIIWDDEDE